MLSVQKAKQAIIEQLTPKMQAVTQQVTAEIKARAPVATGRLRDSITAEMNADQNGVNVTWHDGVDYGVWQELGTSRMPPHPYMRPAMYDLEKSLPRRLRGG